MAPPIVLVRKLSLSTHHIDKRAGGQLKLHPHLSVAEPCCLLWAASEMIQMPWSL